jgi:hypothetical protein
VGKPALKNSVVIMPEKGNYSLEGLEKKECIICSDYTEELYKAKICK